MNMDSGSNIWLGWLTTNRNVNENWKGAAKMCLIQKICGKEGMASFNFLSH